MLGILKDKLSFGVMWSMCRPVMGMLMVGLTRSQNVKNRHPIIQVVASAVLPKRLWVNTELRSA